LIATQPGRDRHCDASPLRVPVVIQNNDVVRVHTSLHDTHVLSLPYNQSALHDTSDSDENHIANITKPALLVNLDHPGVTTPGQFRMRCVVHNAYTCQFLEAAPLEDLCAPLDIPDVVLVTFVSVRYIVVE